MENNELGIFQNFWDGVHPHHLPLLNLRPAIINENWNLNISLQRLEAVLTNNDKARILADMLLLIKADNWRPKLLFCIALLKLGKAEQASLLKPLWEELTVNRSWVIPQLVVTASIIDPKFKEKAKAVLKTRGSGENLAEMEEQQLIKALSRSQFEDKGFIALRWKERLMKIACFFQGGF